MTLLNGSTNHTLVGKAEWPVDPTELAVEYSRRSLSELPPAFCIELGRRLLLAELEFSGWVLRRVDKVGLERDRSVSRRSTFEFTIRSDAPVFTTSDGSRLLLMPLTIMRRQTLVNLNLRDEHDEPLTIPGIRVAQQFDESILLAAAAAFNPKAAHHPEVHKFITAAIAGTLDEVNDAFGRFDGDVGFRPWEFPSGLRDDPLFCAVVNRFRHAFTLYVFLAEKEPRHRLIHMSFDEPTAWIYQLPSLKQPEHSTNWVYQTGRLRRFSPARAWAALGFAPTRFRFQTPGAENAASYHFEISAPQGVQIVRATLLAGRPNDPCAGVSLDRIVGHSPTVGLHAVEVPNGSLCRVQVDLRAPFRGWLTTMLVASFAVLAVVGSVAVHWWSKNHPDWNDGQVTNLVLLLVTTSAAVATLVAQRDSGDVASRFVGGVRAFGTASIATPVVAAAVLVYSAMEVTKANREGFVKHALVALTSLSALIFVAIFSAWICSFVADRRAIIEESPWDMTAHPKDETKPSRRKKYNKSRAIRFESSTNYHFAVRQFKFHRQAVGVKSAEGWHTHYGWNRELQDAAVTALTNPYSTSGRANGCASFSTRCSARADCSHLKAPKQR